MTDQYAAVHVNIHISALYSSPMKTAMFVFGSSRGDVQVELTDLIKMLESSCPICQKDSLSVVGRAHGEEYRHRETIPGKQTHTSWQIEASSVATPTEMCGGVLNSSLFFI